MTTIDLTNAQWAKSSYSGNGGDCVEVAPKHLVGLLPVRDSKDPNGPALVFPAASWTSFITAVQSGEFGQE